MTGEGEILRKYLVINEIGVGDIIKKFEVNRAAVYRYFKTKTFSPKIKQRFKKHFDIDVDHLIATQRQKEGFENNMVTEKEESYTRTDIESYLKNEIREKDLLIKELSSVLKEQIKVINTLISKK